MRGRGDGSFGGTGVVELGFGSSGAQGKQHAQHALVGIKEQVLAPAHALDQHGYFHVAAGTPYAITPPRRYLQFEKFLHCE